MSSLEDISYVIIVFAAYVIVGCMTFSEYVNKMTIWTLQHSGLYNLPFFEEIVGAVYRFCVQMRHKVSPCVR